MAGLQPPNVAATSPSQIMTNSFVTANWTDALQFLLNKPIFQGYNASTQSVANGSTGVAVQLTSENADTYSGHSNVTNSSRYTGPAPGWYWVSGSVSFAPNTTGDRKAWISVNGTALGYTNVQVSANSSGSNATTLSVPATLVQLNGSTDYVEIWAAQTSGGSLNLNPNTNNESSMSVSWDHM